MAALGKIGAGLGIIALLVLAGLYVGTPDAPDVLSQRDDPEAAYRLGAQAVGAVEWSPALERQIAGLIMGKMADEAALAAVLDSARPALAQLERAAGAPSWAAPDDRGARAPRGEWEAALWLLHGEALRLLAAGEDEAAFAKALTAIRIGRLIEGAEGGGVSDILIGEGLREAGLIGLMRLAALDPPGLERARALAARIGPAPELEAAREAALRRESLVAIARIEAMRDDPLPALGMGAEMLPPEVRARPADALFDVQATQEAVAGAFLRASDSRLDACAAATETAAPPVILPFTQNPAGLVLAHQLGEALGRLEDRACLTEATRRAAVLALTIHAARTAEGALPPALPQPWPGTGPLADPFTGAPFAYLPEAGLIVSAGRDRDPGGAPGSGPFDDQQPAYPLEPERN